LLLGLGVGAFELTAIGIIQLLGWVFLPVFIATGVSTLPEYMNRRFGGQRIRIYIACLYLLLYIFTKISVNIYASSLFLNYAFSWNIYLSVLFILVLTAVCTITGGLTSVMYTDTLQAVIMILGGFLVMILSYKEIGGLSNLYRRYLNATPIDQIGNSSMLGTCGQPTMKSFQMLRSASDPDMPWLGFFLGQTPNTIWYWCSYQMMVQRVLAAKSVSHARGGTLLAGYLKILPLFMIVIPGMISRVLYPNIVACNQPSTCELICNSKRSCTNIAYPTLILHILPQGFKGIMLAVMLAALISGLTSIFNSASTIFTVDIYPNIFCSRRNQIKTRELMIVGRLFVVLMTIFGILWIPVVIQMQGSDIYIYMQQVVGYFAPPIACIYLLAVLWKRTNECGAFYGLMIGFCFGLLRMILEFSKQPPLCGEEDTRFWFIRRVHFMYYAMFLFWITFSVCVIVSLCTKPPTKEQLFRTTYWTRNQISNDDQIIMNERIDGTTSILR
jgi:sodium/myo-inositol cotransporter 3